MKTSSALRICLAVCAFEPAAAQTEAEKPPESVYVTDQLFTGAYRDASPRSRRIHRFPAGTKLEVVETKGPMTRVRGSAGETGWVESEFLTTELPARLVVAILEDEKREIKEENDLLKAQLANIPAPLCDRPAAEPGAAAEACAAERAREAELVRKLADTERACPAPTDAAAQIPEQPAHAPDSGPTVPTANAIASGKLAGFVIVVLVLGLGLGAYTVDYLQRRRHGGFRL